MVILGVEVMVVVALGLGLSLLLWGGPDVGEGVPMEALPLDRPKDLHFHVQLLWTSCLHTPPLHPLPLALSPALQALLALQPHPQTKRLYLVSLGKQGLSGVLHRGRNQGR